MASRFLNGAEQDQLRKRIIKKFGSVSKLSKAIGISSCDISSVLNGKKPLYEKWGRLIEQALSDDFKVIDIYEYRRIKEIFVDYWLSGKAKSVEVHIQMQLKDGEQVDKIINWKE